MNDFATVQKLATQLPGVEESTSYGTPALKVKGKLMARLHEDGKTLVIRVTWEEREMVMTMYPETYFLTDHYRNHPWVLMRLGVATKSQLAASLDHAWRQTAPKKLLQERS